MNKRPANIILAALKRTWHLFVRGISRLDFNGDNYIERIFKDMVIRYVPFFHDSSSPILRCLDTEMDCSASSFLLESIANTYLVCKSKTSHEYSLQTLKLILAMSRSRADCEKFQIFAKIMLPYLFDQLIFINDGSVRQIILQIIESIKSNPFSSELRTIFNNSILMVIDKHLAFYSTNVFRFIELLIPIMSNERENIVLNLEEAIKKVECMRGAGYDNTLRERLQRLKTLVKESK